MMQLAVALAFLGLNFYTYNYLATDPVIPDRTLFEEFPRTLEDWTCHESAVLEPGVIKNLGVTDYLQCTYVRGEREQVGVYIGYHQSQVREEGGGAGENSIHPPAHCLPGSGWDIIDNQTVELDLEGMPTGHGLVKRLIIARGEARQLTYYWYQSRGRVISQDWKKILYVGLDRASIGRTDGSLVRFSIPIFHNDEQQADASFRDIASQILSRIPAYVPL
jgi:EpsI family protein